MTVRRKSKKREKNKQTLHHSFRFSTLIRPRNEKQITATAVPSLTQQLNLTVARRLKPIKFDTQIKLGAAHEFGKLCCAGTAVARHTSSASSDVLAQRGFKCHATAMPISMHTLWYKHVFAVRGPPFWISNRYRSTKCFIYKCDFSSTFETTSVLSPRQIQPECNWVRLGDILNGPPKPSISI